MFSKAPSHFHASAAHKIHLATQAELEGDSSVDTSDAPSPQQQERQGLPDQLPDQLTDGESDSTVEEEEPTPSSASSAIPTISPPTEIQKANILAKFSENWKTIADSIQRAKVAPRSEDDNSPSAEEELSEGEDGSLEEGDFEYSDDEMNQGY
ncbi:hypothetical protein CPB84DRAFT_1846837 [Gymnopilus junonius]|uniref:Uncharacterized protein n=1 Tax=Gymnopilus junonius TaxID=109634 RepID=A0A9P5NNK4_GYMJU|nr:hypothetical protein CPB84DRAFT_1846837 [Gymnopilus junonius]